MGAAIAGIAAAAIGAGTSIATANNAPTPPSPRRVARGTAQARDVYGGRVYSQDYEDSLRYSALNQLLQGYGLFGSPGGTIDVPFRQQISGGRSVTRTRTLQNPQSEGLLSLIGRTAPELDRLRENTDPEGDALMRLLTGDASSLLQRGSNPYEDRETVQGLRGAQSARGMGYGNSDALMELLGLDRSRDSRRIQRGGYAGDVLALRRNVQGDPVAEAIRLLGAGSASQGGPAVRSPLFSGQDAALANSAYAGQLSNYNAMANNIASSVGGGAQLGMSIYGANQARRGPGYGPGGNYYNNPYAQASMPIY